MSHTPHTAIRNWLLLCCFMVLTMAVVGAITRLTESGLSITEWKPIAGTLPPLNDADWQRNSIFIKPALNSPASISG